MSEGNGSKPKIDLDLEEYAKRLHALYQELVRSADRNGHLSFQVDMLAADILQLGGICNMEHLTMIMGEDRARVVLDDIS